MVTNSRCVFVFASLAALLCTQFADAQSASFAQTLRRLLQTGSARRLEGTKSEESTPLIAEKLVHKGEDGQYHINQELEAAMSEHDMLLSLKLMDKAEIGPDLAKLWNAQPESDNTDLPKGFTVLLPSDKAWQKHFDKFVKNNPDKPLDGTELENQETIRKMLLRHFILADRSLWSTEIEFDKTVTNVNGEKMKFSVCPNSEPALVCVYWGDQTVPVEAANIGGNGFVIHRLGDVLFDAALFTRTVAQQDADNASDDSSDDHSSDYKSDDKSSDVKEEN
eukprot:Selendium_serpulae@DN755_c0_g1_i1.p1